MAHIEQLNFFKSVFDVFPHYFQNVKASVLDIGSLDINGGPHALLNSNYVGVDIGPGKNVDLVCPGQLLDFKTGHFDATISSECLEHNPFWRETIINMARMTRAGGLVVWSCAGIGRAVHGTSTSHDLGISAPHIAKSSDYYKNVDARSARNSFNHDGWFSDFCYFENLKSNDTYFVGIRHGASKDDSKAFYDLKLSLKERYGDCRKLILRRIFYLINARTVVEKSFDLYRFLVVVATADKKALRTRKKILVWLGIRSSSK